MFEEASAVKCRWNTKTALFKFTHLSVDMALDSVDVASSFMVRSAEDPKLSEPASICPTVVSLRNSDQTEKYCISTLEMFCR